MLGVSVPLDEEVQEEIEKSINVQNFPRGRGTVGT